MRNYIHRLWGCNCLFLSLIKLNFASKWGPFSRQNHNCVVPDILAWSKLHLDNVTVRVILVQLLIFGYLFMDLYIHPDCNVYLCEISRWTDVICTERSCVFACPVYSWSLNVMHVDVSPEAYMFISDYHKADSKTQGLTKHLFGQWGSLHCLGPFKWFYSHSVLSRWFPQQYPGNVGCYQDYDYVSYFNLIFVISLDINALESMLSHFKRTMPNTCLQIIYSHKH